MSAAAAPAYLIDDRAKLAHPLAERSTTIGRDASNEIVVRDPTASRFHAEVRRQDDAFVIDTMGASGTLVNGAPMTGPRELAEGDTIEIAFVTFRFTRAPLSRDIVLAPAHSTENDEVSRKPTLGSGRALVDDANAAGKDLRRVQLVVLVVIVLLAGWWWLSGRG